MYVKYVWIRSRAATSRSSAVYSFGCMNVYKLFTQHMCVKYVFIWSHAAAPWYSTVSSLLCMHAHKSFAQHVCIQYVSPAAVLQRSDAQPSHLFYVCMHANCVPDVGIQNKFHLQPCCDTLILRRLVLFSPRTESLRQHSHALFDIRWRTLHDNCPIWQVLL